MLLRDHLIPDISVDGNLYELNFIPIEEYPEDVIEVKDIITYNFMRATSTIYYLIERYNKNQDIYVLIEDEGYRVEIEVLETKE